MPLTKDFFDSIRLFKDEYLHRINEPILIQEQPKEEPKQVAKKSLVIKYAGRFLSRMSTDPDCSNHLYGVSGKSYAYVGEPVMSREIFFQPSSRAYVRDHCQGASVLVTDAYVIDSKTNETLYSVANLFKDAKVDLLESPIFESKNHLLIPDSEAVDPFVISITNENVNIVRRPKHPLFVDATAAQRQQMITTRQGVMQPYGPATKIIMQRMSGIDDEVEYVKKKMSLVEKDLETVKNQLAQDPSNAKLHLKKAQLTKRNQEVALFLQRDNKDRLTNFRITALKYYLQKVTFKLDGDFKFSMANMNSAIVAQPWHHQLFFSFYDMDCATGLVCNINRLLNTLQLLDLMPHLSFLCTRKAYNSAGISLH